MTKKVIDRGKRSKTLSEVKLVENISKFFLSLSLSYVFIVASLFISFSKVVVFSSFNFSNELLVDVVFSLLCTKDLEIFSFISFSSRLSSIQVLLLLIFSCVDL